MRRAGCRVILKYHSINEAGRPPSSSIESLNNHPDFLILPFSRSPSNLSRNFIMNLKTITILLSLCETLFAVPIQGSQKDKRQGLGGFNFGDLASTGTSGTSAGSNTNPFGSLFSGIIPSMSSSGSSAGTGNMILPAGALTSGSQIGNDETNQGQSGSGDFSQGGEDGEEAAAVAVQDGNEGDGLEDETVA